MQNSKADLVIECVRYLSSGVIDSVRLYERRGSAYSDRVIYSRQQLMQALTQKKRIFTGQRLAGKAGSFDLLLPVILCGSSTDPIITTSVEATDHDHLQDLPLF